MVIPVHVISDHYAASPHVCIEKSNDQLSDMEKSLLRLYLKNKGLYYPFLGAASHFYSWTEMDEIFEVKCFEIERRTEFHYVFEKRAFVDLYEIKMQFETTRSRILLYIDST